MVDCVSLTKRPEFIDIMSYDEYITQSDGDIIDKLRYRHLLITGGPNPALSFDNASLRKLAPLKKVITVHGLLFSSLFLQNNMLTLH